MALAGNCGYGALARLGGGDLRAFVIVLVMGVSAYTVLSGPLAPLRDALFPQVAATASDPPGLAHQLGAALALPVPAVGFAIGRSCCSSPGLARVLEEAASWSGRRWWASAWCRAGPARPGSRARVSRPLPVVSHSFAAPLGETILWCHDRVGARRPAFGVGSVAGVWTGAFLGSLLKGHFRWEACEDPRELRRQILGAALMGAGAVIAMGCTIGQGLSAFSLLAFERAGDGRRDLAGAALGLRQLIVGWAPTGRLP